LPFVRNIKKLVLATLNPADLLARNEMAVLISSAIMSGTNTYRFFPEFKADVSSANIRVIIEYMSTTINLAQGYSTALQIYQ